MNDGILVKRLILARNTLLNEGQFAWSGKVLGSLALGEAPHLSQLMKTFLRGVDNSIESGAIRNGDLVAQKLEELLVKQAKAIFARADNRTLIQKALKRTITEEQFIASFEQLLKSSDPVIGRAMTTAFNKTPVTALFDLKATDATVTALISEMRKENITLNRFDELLIALQVRSIANDPRLQVKIVSQVLY